MKKLLFLWVVLAALVMVPEHADAQLFKKKKKDTEQKKDAKPKKGDTVETLYRDGKFVSVISNES